MREAPHTYPSTSSRPKCAAEKQAAWTPQQLLGALRESGASVTEGQCAEAIRRLNAKAGR